MAKTSLIISSTAVSDGKKLQKTLTDINSAATNDQLKSFAQVLNNLTTNTYIETNRVDRTNCDSESGAGGLGKAFRNMAITGGRDCPEARRFLRLPKRRRVGGSICFTDSGNKRRSRRCQVHFHLP